MSSKNKGNEKGRFTLCAKRPTEIEWSTWTNTDDLETLINNIKIIEEYGNQWEVTETSEYTQWERKRISDVEKATREGYLKGYSQGCADEGKQLIKRIIQYVDSWVGIAASLDKSTMLWEMCEDLKGIAKNEFGIELESEVPG